MATTIQISTSLLNELRQHKLFERETYEEVIRDLLEDTKELSEETKKNIEQARSEIAKGKYHTHEQVKKELGL